MKTVYKDGLTRIITTDRVKEYQAAGWTLQEPVGKIVSAEALQLKTPAKSKGAAKSLDNDISTGE